ncbi:Hypothetical protein SRAE_2000363800 [Strongyloides ratti]|uniref:Uncharacterized protein n=1 Tax=Strongyloides ratti TaxID=34506 RepID=A0A090LN79_STRRB|nr:Hypothetical protein SRAE_2000363800 [Strongyloides ratti]CEF68985.1 Hypothetical protein SRAE_2000363800 [Strongyloides ratti]
MKLFKNFFTLIFIISLTIGILVGAPNKEKKLEKKKKSGKSNDLKVDGSISSGSDNKVAVNDMIGQKKYTPDKPHHHKHSKKEKKIKKDKKIKKNEDHSKNKEKKNKKKCNCKNKKKSESRSKNGRKID